MAVLVSSKVWEGFPGSGTELLAMLALADWSDDDGRCWPSIAGIARKIRLGEKQTRRVIHSLIEAGFLIVTGRHSGGSASRRYQIQLGKLTPPLCVTPPAKGRAPTEDPLPLPPAGDHPSHSYGSRTVIDTSDNRQSTPPKKRAASQTSLPDDFAISERVREWASEKNFGNLESHFEAFVLKAQAKGYKYSDWDAAFMAAIRKNWAGVVDAKASPASITGIRFEN